MIRRIFLFFAVFPSIFVLTSCPLPITQEILNNVTDDISPLITILTPDDGSYCAKSVIITGTVSDSSTETGLPGKVAGLQYEILSSTVSGDISQNEDGSFSFEFSTENFGSNFVLKITAEDWNGNTGETNLNLQKLEGNDIPSFSAVPGDGQVVLSWDEVPNTSSYTLYYTTDGTTPSEIYGEYVSNITSPYTLDSLNNGAMHVFQLCANPLEPGGADNRSDYLQAIPLSLETLEPDVLSETGQLTVRWPEIPATETFEVWRGRDEDGSYVQIANRITGNEFTDRQVPGKGGYFYKIKPALETCTLSSPGFGSPSAFPAAYEIVTTIATDDSVNGTAVSGDYLFIAEHNNTLKIADISDPVNSVVVKTVDLPGASASQYAFNAAAAGGYAFVANGTEGMQIIDIDPIADASVVHQVKKNHAAESAKDVVVDAVNGYAYIADSFFGLLIMDISTPSSASIYKEVSVSGAKALAVYGRYVYIAVGTSGIKTVDLIDPSDPINAAVVSAPITAPNANDVYVADDSLYIATGDNSAELRIFDISAPTSPSASGTVDIVDGTFDDAVGVTVAGGFAYVSDESSGVQIVNVALTRSAMNLYVKTYVDSSNARGVSVAGDYLYLADSAGGTRVINILNPSVAETVLTEASAGTPWGIDVRGNYAYIAEATSGLVIMDISNPLSPALVNTVSTPGEARDVALLGNYAFVADWYSGIQIVDISNHGTASIVKSLTTGDGADVIKTSGDFLYVGANSAGVLIYDISEPESAFLVKAVDVDDQIRDIVISGDYLYAADDTAGIKVIDIEIPPLAETIHTLFNGAPPMYDGTTLALSIYDRYLLAGVSSVTNDDANVLDNSILVYDISDPEAVDQVEYAYPLINFTAVYDIGISGDYAYLSTANYGLQILDLTYLSRAGFIAQVTTSAGIYDSAVLDDYVFCAAAGAGLQIIDIRP